MDYSRPALAEALAALYVTGTLRGPARRRLEALLPAHPALGAAVQHWRDRLVPLASVVPPVAPPTRVWPAISAQLWPEQAAPAHPHWWHTLTFWRGWAALASVATLGLALLVLQPAATLAPVVVVLQATGDGAGGGAPGIVASISGDGAALVTRPLQPVGLAPGRALELWAVPPQGAPRSLGLISASGLTVLRRERLPATLLDTGRTAALAVSVEPPGGSPTGAPTGPVVYAGKLQL